MLKDFLFNSKKRLRTQLTALRNSISATQKLAIEEQITTLFIDKFNGFSSYGAYYPINNEVDILPTIHLLQQTGKNLGLPCIQNNELIFRLWQPEEPLIKTLYAFEPMKNSTPVIPEVVLTPLLGFDRTGYRLGYGGGYYDRYFSKHHHPIKVGIAFACQEVDKLPHESHDQKLDFIVTENGILTCL
jgi:5-formyltetrahydrofolate cyclo-ligase